MRKQISDSIERSYRLSNSFLFLNYLSHSSDGKKASKREEKRKSS